VFGFVSVYADYGMSFDARGGHNRKRINEKFFDTWSPNMAYVLGLVYADGALIDAKKSSRTQYFIISSSDKDFLYKIRSVLNSNHKIQIRVAGIKNFFGKEYFCADHFRLRVGNKRMYKSLVSRGLSTKKSLTMKFPSMPNEYLSYFLRGYFDGDGCVYTRYFENKRNVLSVIFTSGSYDFIHSLRQIIRKVVGTCEGSLNNQDRAYRLRYRKIDGILILKFIYQNLESAPYLDRKYLKFQEFMHKEGFD
jgi:intein/homing endonuclease